MVQSLFTLVFFSLSVVHVDMYMGSTLIMSTVSDIWEQIKRYIYIKSITKCFPQLMLALWLACLWAVPRAEWKIGYQLNVDTTAILKCIDAVHFPCTCTQMWMITKYELYAH